MSPRAARRRDFDTNIDHFVDHLRYGKNASPATIRAYASDLRSFVTFLEESDLPTDVSRIDTHGIRAWLTSLHRAGTQKSSMSRKVSTLRSFFKYLVVHGNLGDPRIRNCSITWPRGSSMTDGRRSG